MTGPGDPDAAPLDPTATIRSRRFLVLLVLAAGVGLIVSLASWCFLELIHQIQVGVFDDLPDDLGYHHGAPLWWYLPVLGVAGLLAALAIVRLPGHGGHIPAYGLNAGGATLPIDLPGVLLAAVATLGLGLVLGPEAPLIALGGGLGLLATRMGRRDVPPQVAMVVAASGSFAALSFIFDSPLIAAVILIEATGIGGAKLPVVLLPGLLAAGIGSLVSIGMGSFTGLSTSAYALGAVAVPAYARPELSDLAWTIPLAAAVAVFTFAVLRLARMALPVVARHPLLITPVAGLAVAGLAILFAETTDKGAEQVLFSGQTALPSLVADASAWSAGALALLLAFKGLAWSISLAGFRGGPTFPALFIGAAGGILASQLPGLALTPAIAVGMGAAVVSVLRLPLSAALLAIVLTSQAGPGAWPLIILGVVVAYLVTIWLSPKPAPAPVAPREEPARPSARAAVLR